MRKKARHKSAISRTLFKKKNLPRLTSENSKIVKTYQSDQHGWLLDPGLFLDLFHDLSPHVLISVLKEKGLTIFNSFSKLSPTEECAPFPNRIFNSNEIQKFTIIYRSNGIKDRNTYLCYSSLINNRISQIAILFVFRTRKPSFYSFFYLVHVQTRFPHISNEEIQGYFKSN